MIKICIIYIITFIFGCLWLHTFATLCSNVGTHGNRVLEFCSGANLTGSNISLSTANASTRATNCTCEFTVTTTTFIHINGDCTTEILHGFHDVQVAEKCGNILQYMETSQVLKFVYLGSSYGNTDTNTSCKHLYSQQGLLEGACFEEPLIPTTETSTPIIISTTNEKEETSKTVPKVDIPTTVHQTTTTATKTTSNKDDNSQLIIAISASAGGIIFTLFVLITVLICLRKTKSRKGKRQKMVSSARNRNQADDCDDEMEYNEIKNNRYNRRGSQHTIHTTNSNHDDATSHIHIHVNVPTSPQVATNDSMPDPADDKSNNFIYRSKNGHQSSRHTGKIYSNNKESMTSSVHVDENDSTFDTADDINDNFILQSRNEHPEQIYGSHGEPASCDFIHLDTNIPAVSDTGYSTFSEGETDDKSTDKDSNSSESESDQMSTTTEQSNDEDVRTTTSTLPDTHV